MLWPGKGKTCDQQDESGDLIVHIDSSWSDNQGIYLKGWILNRRGVLEAVHIAVGNDYIPISNWHERPDIVPLNRGLPEKSRCGFTVYIPHMAEHRLSFVATVDGETSVKTLNFLGSQMGFSVPFKDASCLFNEFIDRVNSNRLKVLEIGSRIVSPGSSSKRPLFPQAISFTGFDIYPDENTDVIGDAHQLSRYFRDEKFDAVFSIAVFEHLAMPWLVAREINKILKTGGITFHGSHFSWPLHEVPWDFYRYSDEGFKSLFPPPMGYRIIKAGMFLPLRMYFDSIQPGQEDLPFYSGFGGSAILAEKVFDVDDSKFRWDTNIEAVLGKESRYPKKQV